MTCTHLFARISAAAAALSLALAAAAQTAPPATPHRNVILFVADGLRRGSVNAQDTPALYRLRTQGTDLRNSHSIFPTFTTANASAIATGHGLGDTGDFSNTIYPGLFLAQPLVPTALGSVTPFLEADDILANLNGNYNNNYLGEKTLLTAAREHGFNVASIGKLGPTAIQQIEAVNRDETGNIAIPDTIIVDDSTGHPTGVPLPLDLVAAIDAAGLPLDAPNRSNGFGDTSQGSNGFVGDAVTPGTRAANLGQQQWLADVATQVVLPRFAADSKPFVLLFWSRDPDGTQHNQGDSLQNLSPGINSETSRRGLRNADNCLQALLTWLDQHPAIKANTDVLVTSDHGFATISRRELDRTGTLSAEPSASLLYEPSGKDKPQQPHTLPTGFLSIDLALWGHMRLFDPAVRATTGNSVYAELAISGELAHYPSTGSALLGDTVRSLDGSDAKLIVASNGGSDLIYSPAKDPVLIKQTLELLSGFDYVDGIFVDDAYCPTVADCPGALPLSAIRLKGATHLPTPAIVVTYKNFNRVAGDLQTGIQVADTTLQEGQGMHGGFGRDQTWNNMAAIGPDFRTGFVDPTPVGNMDIAPTIASILGFELPATGKIKGRILQEAIATSPAAAPDAGADAGPATPSTLVSPPSNGRVTVLQFQEHNGVRYLDRACMLPTPKTGTPSCNN